MATEAGTATRRAAAAAAAAVDEGRSLSDALPPLLAALPARERGLAQELAYGTVRWRLRLDALLAPLLKRRPPDPLARALLAVGLYQLRFTRIPPHAAVSATVAAAPPKLRGLVNGVLRNAQRRAAELDGAIAGDAVAQCAHPRWLLERLQAEWPQDWQAIVDAGNRPAPMTLRVNRRRATRDAFRATLAGAGIGAAPLPHLDDALQLDSPLPVAELPGFADGKVSVQDGAAQFAAALLDARAGMRVLDACAAPGGKTCHIAEREPGLAALFAVERDPARAGRIDGSLARLGLAAQVVRADAAQPDAWWDGRAFDRILLDAPCSASGVIRRHPDIKALRRAADIDALQAAQLELLHALWPLLAAGGRLLYATCSVLHAENDAVVAAFAATTTGVRVAPLAADWGHATRYGRQRLPGQDDMDGFYYAVMGKEPA